MKRKDSKRRLIILNNKGDLEISIFSGKTNLQIFNVVNLELFRLLSSLSIGYYFCFFFLDRYLPKESIFFLMTFPLVALTLDFLKALFDVFESVHIGISSSKIIAVHKIFGITLDTNSKVDFRILEIIAYPIQKRSFVWGRRDLIYKPFLVIDFGQDKIKLRSKYISAPEIEELAFLLSENLECPLRFEYLR